MTIYKALSMPEQVALQREVEELRARVAARETHEITQDRGSSGMESWIQPKCSCGWVGAKEYAHNDCQYANVVEQEHRHLFRFTRQG